jgi:Protein of unknown function (DUF3592)
VNDFLLFVGIISVVVVATAAKRWFVRERAEGWSQANGRVESGEVSGIRSYPSWKSTFTATINYSYSVNGDWFAGKVVERFNNEQKAWDFVDRYKGKEILVRYNPNRPAKSVLWQVLGGEIYAR